MIDRRIPGEYHASADIVVESVGRSVDLSEITKMLEIGGQAEVTSQYWPHMFLFQFLYVAKCITMSNTLGSVPRHPDTHTF